MQRKIISTADGSPSLFVEDLKETYHSRHGAVTESAHVYIKKGLSFWYENHQKDTVRIFEMGWGTGLNTYLTYLFFAGKENSCEYTAVEKYPLNQMELQALEMKKSLPASQHHAYFDQMHQQPWEQFLSLHHFMFKKRQDDFLTMKISQTFDLVYYDAFGHHAQSEMWQEPALKKCYDIMEPHGVWVSYCAKGSVRRTLQNIGFAVERLEGPPGKREMLRAIKAV